LRLGLILWGVLGLGLIGLKAHLDRTHTKYADVAVKAGSATYFVPRAFVTDSGWRADLMRLGGCWDVREAGMVSLAASVAGCEARSLKLRIPARALGAEAEALLRGKALDAMFWPIYAPPAEHMPQLLHAWAGRNEWEGRVVVRRDDWGLVRLQTTRSPWVPLLTGEPQTGDPSELAALYAGRCYRPDVLSDIGMTCALALRMPGGAVIEYALGPDEIGAFGALRQAVAGAVGAWMAPLSSKRTG
jgi:hypothetical protein